MILISVDLPAPLSPSSPSTSPLRRCMLMSRSAIVGPKRLAMCWTRRTSSSAVAGATIRSPAKVSATAGSPAHARDVDVDGHCDDDRDPEVEIDVVGADALDDQAIVEDAEEQRPDEGTDYRPGAAGHQRAADDHRRYRLEQDRVRARRVRGHARRPHRLENPGEAGGQRAQYEGADQHEPDIDARLRRAEAVSTRGDGVHARAAERQHNLQDGHDRDRPDELRVRARPEDLREVGHLDDRGSGGRDLL